MSRKKTDSAVEHRITLGDLERREMRQVLKLAKTEKTILNVTNGVKAAAVVGVAGAGIYVGYLGILAYAAVKDGIDDVIGTIKQTVHDVPISFYNWTAGSKSQIDPETGIEYIVPKEVVDESGLVIKNPAGGYPVFGGLVYLGMWAGNTFNPFDEAPTNGDTAPARPDVPPDGTWYGPHVPGHPDYDAWIAGDYQMTLAEYNKWQTILQAERMREQNEARRAAEQAAAEERAEEDPVTSGEGGPSWVQAEREAEERRRKEAEEAANREADRAAAEAEAEREREEQEAAGMPCPGAPRPDLPCNHRFNRGF